MNGPPQKKIRLTPTTSTVVTSSTTYSYLEYSKAARFYGLENNLLSLKAVFEFITAAGATVSNENGSLEVNQHNNTVIIKLGTKEDVIKVKNQKSNPKMFALPIFSPGNHKFVITFEHLVKWTDIYQLFRQSSILALAPIYDQITEMQSIKIDFENIADANKVTNSKNILNCPISFTTVKSPISIGIENARSGAF